MPTEATTTIRADRLFATDYFEDVANFNRRFGLPVDLPEPRRLEPADLLYKFEHLQEEVLEMVKGQAAGDLVQVADGVVDLVYVLLGVPHFMGYADQARAAWLERARRAPGVPTGVSPYVDAVTQYAHTGADIPLKPTLLEGYDFQDWLTTVTDQLSILSASFLRGGPADWAAATRSMLAVCLDLACRMGLPFDALWRDVQRANLEKRRAGNAEEAFASSGRRSPWDVIKPEGWRPPTPGSVLYAHGANLRPRFYYVEPPTGEMLLGASFESPKDTSWLMAALLGVPRNDVSITEVTDPDEPRRRRVRLEDREKPVTFVEGVNNVLNRGETLPVIVGQVEFDD